MPFSFFVWGPCNETLFSHTLNLDFISQFYIFLLFPTLCNIKHNSHQTLKTARRSLFPQSQIHMYIYIYIHIHLYKASKLLPNYMFHNMAGIWQYFCAWVFKRHPTDYYKSVSSMTVWRNTSILQERLSNFFALVCGWA